MKATHTATLSTWVLRNLLDISSMPKLSLLISVKLRFGACSFQQLPIVLVRLDEEMKLW